MRLHELISLDLVPQVEIPWRLLSWRAEHSLEEGYQRGSVLPCCVPGRCPTYQLYTTHGVSCLIVWIRACVSVRRERSRPYCPMVWCSFGREVSWILIHCFQGSFLRFYFFKIPNCWHSGTQALGSPFPFLLYQKSLFTLSTIGILWCLVGMAVFWGFWGVRGFFLFGFMFVLFCVFFLHSLYTPTVLASPEEVAGDICISI